MAEKRCKIPIADFCKERVEKSEKFSVGNTGQFSSEKLATLECSYVLLFGKWRIFGDSY